MEIYNGYTTDDVLWNEPYIDDKLTLYPLKIREYKEIQPYLQYFMFSKKHYQIDNKTNLFEHLVLLNMSSLKNKISENQYSDMQLMATILQNIANGFTIICKEEIQCDLVALQQGNMILKNEDNSIEINKNNFDKARRIILKQNVIAEPKIFSDKIEKKLAEKWIKSRQQKNSNGISGLGEMANLISCATGKSYDEIYKQNIFQLYCDYYRCTNTEDYKATTLFRTVGDVEIVDYQREIISQLYADPYDGMWKDKNSFLGGLGV